MSNALIQLSILREFVSTQRNRLLIKELWVLRNLFSEMLKLNMMPNRDEATQRGIQLQKSSSQHNPNTGKWLESDRMFWISLPKYLSQPHRCNENQM